MSDDEELLYGLLGTQFNIDEDIDTENRRKKLKRKVIDDEVTDEKGRALRFHGAFTGGFHAGYYNTVGSKEGFVPQQYTSKGRLGDGKPIVRRDIPEDYMDEEDFSEYGIAPRLLRTKSIYDNEDVRDHFKKSLGSNSIIGDSDILKDLLVPQRLTIGMMLLKKLGYYASTGVGDCEIENQKENKSEKFDYQPEDTYNLIGQMNKFGLGYSGISWNNTDNNENDVRNKQAVNFGHKGKRGIRGTAFGVGVDEEEEDLEDFYSGDSMTKYNFEIMEEDGKEMNYGWTAPRTLSKAIMHPGCIVGFQSGKKCSNTSQTVHEPPKPPRFYVPIFPVLKAKENVKEVKENYRPKLMPSDEETSVFKLLSVDDREKLISLGQECRTKRSHSRWGDVKKSECKAEVSPVTEFYPSAGFGKSSENSFKHKKDNRKLWNLNSSLGVMFKSAGSSTETQDINSCLDSITKSSGTTVGVESSSKVLAANHENYGFMTRSTVAWHPDKLLCKRFNIADPYPESNFSGIPDESVTADYISLSETQGSSNSSFKSKPELDFNVSDQLKQEEKIVEQPPISPEKPVSSPVIVEVKTNILDVSNKPEIDLFKAVFADSDAEFSSSDDEETVKPNSITRSTRPAEVNETNKVSEPANMSIVFSMEQALSSMIGGNNERFPSTVKPTSKEMPPPATTVIPSSKGPVYGPTMPPGFVPSSVPVEPVYSVVNQIISKNIKTASKESDDDLYVYKEISEVKKSKKNKKEKKSSKSKKKKSKKDK